ncbi:MAG: CBS domain-containing protein [Gammaproteobacteria bacterium]|nr:CBS domain-containing protein [Gammaproteobacteria bacterium]
MSLKSLMTTDLVTVRMDDSLAMVKGIFDNTNFHHLLVVENKTLVGVISDRDLFKALSPNIDSEVANAKDLATLNKKVHQIMSRKPIVIAPDASVKQAITLFNEHTISCLPVVDENDKPVGIISWRDIMRELEIRLNKVK